MAFFRVGRVFAPGWTGFDMAAQDPAGWLVGAWRGIEDGEDAADQVAGFASRGTNRAVVFGTGFLDTGAGFVGGTVVGIAVQVAGDRGTSALLFGTSLPTPQFQALTAGGGGAAFWQVALAGDDAMRGGPDNDRLLGHGGNDVIDGGVGNDTILGGGWRDTLIGGAGDDVLRNGAGRDAFVFRSAQHGADRIKDFDPASDRIWLDSGAADFAGLGSGGLARRAFALGPAAQDRSDRVIYDPATGILRFDADGIGAEAPVILARMAAGLDLTAAHVRLVDVAPLLELPDFPL
ncbi:MAG: calcium-binding protein [Gemmobacter sp.]